MEYDIDTYNFDDDDDEFQAFFHRRLNSISGGKYIKYDKYMRILINCKKKYMSYLNHDVLHDIHLD